MELIYCASGNPRFAEIAIRTGFTYGAQMPGSVYFKPDFVDQDWKKPNRAIYMQVLAQWKPRMATVLDWEREEQLDEVLSWAEEAAQYVTETVILIPKVHSGIARLPRMIGGKEVRLGYSVPTKYGATQVMAWEFSGWPVHLLGGAPHIQHQIGAYISRESLDCSYIRLIADYGQWFIGKKLRTVKKLSYYIKDGSYLAFFASCHNMNVLWEKTNMPYIDRVEYVEGEYQLFDKNGQLIGRGGSALDAVASMYPHGGELVEKARSQVPGVYQTEAGKWRVFKQRKYAGTYATQQEAEVAALATRPGAAGEKE